MPDTTAEPTPHLPIERYLEVLADAGGRLGADARAAGLDAPVPTCPAWNVRALVAHQAMVHRWAGAVVGETDPALEPKQTALRKRDDLFDYYDEGLERLAERLRSAADDLDVMTFLHAPPPPRIFWARRQAHETTVHGVDALGARLGRVPTGDECAIADDLALDGIDELLGGFYTRGRSGLYDGTAYDIVVAPEGTEHRWVFHVDEKNTLTRTTTTVCDDQAATWAAAISGAPVDIYLGLWNRGDSLQIDGDNDLLARWREAHRVTWG